MAPTRVALITGCSSGIGSATAGHLHDKGFRVYATARRLQDLSPLAQRGMQTLELDVTDEASMIAAVKQVNDEHGGVDILVNNAGFGMVGAVEDTSAVALRAQFETNVVGAVRLTQLVLPGMRTRGWGRIINVSSILGKAGVPGGGAYDATKHALEALSDALRLEVRRFGIGVSLIEPGPVASRFADTATSNVLGDSDTYHEFRLRLADWFADVYGPRPRTLAGRFRVDATTVAKVIERAATARRPRARYPVGLLPRGFLFMRRTLPDAAFDLFVRAQFPVP